MKWSVMWKIEPGPLPAVSPLAFRVGAIEAPVPIAAITALVGLRVPGGASTASPKLRKLPGTPEVVPRVVEEPNGSPLQRNLSSAEPDSLRDSTTRTVFPSTSGRLPLSSVKAGSPVESSEEAEQAPAPGSIRQ